MNDTQVVESSTNQLTEVLDNTVDVHSIDKALSWSLKDAYIDLFTEYPLLSKVEVYRMACEAIGCKEAINPYVAASNIHKRCLDSINKVLNELSVDDRALGRSQLRYLSAMAKSESVRASTSTTLYNVKDTDQAQGIEVTVNRDSVQIKSGKDTLTIENEVK